jgi:hypothetical protein
MIAAADFRAEDRANVVPHHLVLLQFGILLLCASSCLPPLAVCRARGPLPDPLCTPGAVDTRSIAVVCTMRTRDRRFVNRSSRRRVLESYGVSVSDSSQYEVDHLIPLEPRGIQRGHQSLGGAHRRSGTEGPARGCRARGRLLRPLAAPGQAACVFIGLDTARARRELT